MPANTGPERPTTKKTIAWTRERLKALKAKINAVVESAEKVDGLDAKVDSLSTQLEQINNDIDEQLARINALGDTENVGVIDDVNRTTDGIEKEKDDCCEDLNVRLGELEQVVEKHGKDIKHVHELQHKLEGEVAGLSSNLNQTNKLLGELTDSHKATVNVVAQNTDNIAVNTQNIAVNTHNNHANASAFAWAGNQIEKLQESIPVWAWFVAALAGLIAGMLWSSVEFGDTVTTTNASGTTTADVSSMANEAWVAWLVGIFAAVIVFGIILIVLSTVRRSQMQTYAEATAAAQAAAQAGAGGGQLPYGYLGQPAQQQPPAPGGQPGVMVIQTTPQPAAQAVASAGAAATAGVS